MSRAVRIAFAAAILVIVVSSFAVAASQIAGCNEQSGPTTNGSVYLICPASSSTADLMVFAHGFVDPNSPIAIPYNQLVLPDGTSIPAIVKLLGMAFATTSYPTNGLAIVQGTDDIKKLVAYYKANVGTPGRVFLAGVSEGGLVTVKAIETAPELFNGGLAACGPDGDFNFQIHYFMDVRVVFDYFFPGVIPGSATNIPTDVQQDFLACTTATCTTPYATKIRQAFTANPSGMSQLLAVTFVPTGPDPQQSIIDVLWYNAVATNDAVTKLGGNPYDNNSRWYSGSSNDLQMNLGVKRYTADGAALQAIADGYQTTGLLAKPLVTIHTTGDNVVPFLHELIYGWKTSLQGSSGQISILPTVAYGHCNFTAGNAIVGLLTLLSKAH